MGHEESNYYDNDKPRQRPQNSQSTTKKRNPKTRPIKRTKKQTTNTTNKTTTKPDHKHDQKRDQKTREHTQPKNEGNASEIHDHKIKPQKNKRMARSILGFFVVWKNWSCISPTDFTNMNPHACHLSKGPRGRQESSLKGASKEPRHEAPASAAAARDWQSRKTW